jgi:SAM-dependent methyltransferase
MSLNHNKPYNTAIRNWLGRVFEHAKYLSSQQLTTRNCPVCNSSHYSLFANNGYFNYSRCSTCSLIFQNPTVDAAKVGSWYTDDDEIISSMLDIAIQYKTQIPEKPDPLQDNKLIDIYRIKKEGRLLDIGCSVGDFLQKAKFFYHVEGVEVNPTSASIAKQFFTIHQGFLHELNLKEPFDIVTLHQILYGISNPVNLLKEIRKILKRDGILYINTPNADSYAMDLFGGKSNHLYGYATQNVFNYSSLERLAEMTGFKIKTFRTEWLDIYISDIVVFLNNAKEFIHKRNCQVDHYEENIELEDDLHSKLKIDLKNKGNYLIAVLEKTG